jgi:hypothetical protein
MQLPQHDGALTIAHRRSAWEQLRFANTAEAAVARRQNNLFRGKAQPASGSPAGKTGQCDRPAISRGFSDRSVPTWRYTTADFAPHPLRDPQKSMRDRPYYLSAVICGDVALSCRRILMSRVSPGRSSASSFEITPCAASDPFLKIII